MANILKNFLDYLKLSDDDDDYDLYEEEFEERESTRSRKQERLEAEREQMAETAAVGRVKEERKKAKQLYSARTAADEGLQAETTVKKQRPTRMERTTNNKIVPIRTTPMGLEVCIMKPSSFEDSQDICDMLLSGRAVVVNLEGFDANDAQRIMDFISGSVYAVNGKLHQISRYIFIFSPDTIDISGDYLELVNEDGFEVPTLNKEF